MTTHPSSLDLEAFACGEVSSGRQRVAEHVEQCDACSGFVERLSAFIAPSADTARAADALVARALANVADPLPASPLRLVSSPPKDRKGRWWLLTTSAVTPLAAAAAILLLTRSNHGGGAPPAKPTATTSASAESVPVPGVAQEPDTTFKGGMQIAVVRDRAGEQARFASGVPVRPGDRLRVEVALDREQAIVGAVLADDGSYLELMPQAVRGPGTHFSERSAKIDASPTHGTIVIGTPEAVARARATRQLDGVASLRVESEGTP